MYRKHPLLEQPQNSRQKLWRYLKYERLLQIVDTGFLFFPHISQFSDKWEGLLTERTRESLFRTEHARYKDASVARQAVDNYESSKDDFYIQCWHMSNHQSYLMWKVYADRGCAIQTNYERLVASFPDDSPEVNGCVVSYIDYEKDLSPIGNVYSSVSYKDLPYKDEKEFRLLFWKISLLNQNYSVGDLGVEIAVDVDMLIDNIYINPSKDTDAKKLRASLEGKGIKCEIRHSRIKRNETV
jgi:hypothetical protein